MSRLRISASILLVWALVAATTAAASPSLTAGVEGKVSSRSAPLGSAAVYAYQLADLSLEKVVTDSEGEFAFASLPVGLYKIIAFKPGFVPTVVMLSRMAADARQFLDLELSPHVKTVQGDGGFWELREKIPSDVLRDIQIAAATHEFGASAYPGAGDANFSAGAGTTVALNPGNGGNRGAGNPNGSQGSAGGTGGC